MIVSLTTLALVVLVLVVLAGLRDRLTHVQELQLTILQRENAQMSIGQEILDALAGITASQDAQSNAITALSTTVDTAVVEIEKLVTAGTITPEQAAAILGTAATDKANADAATAAAAAANQKLADEIAKVSPPAQAPAITL